MAMFVMATADVCSQSEMQWHGGTVYNFGTILEDDGPVSHRFVLRNAGDEAYSIVSASATCGCTTATHSSHVIAPDDTASVTVTFNPQRREGLFHQRVAVITNSRSRINYLFVKGNVVSSRQRIEKEFPVAKEKMRLAEDTLYIYTRRHSGKAAACLRCINDSPSALSPTAVHVPDGATIEFSPKQPAAGERFSIVLSCSLRELRHSMASGDNMVSFRADAETTEVDSIPILVEYRE